MTSVSRVRLLLGTVLCALLPGIAAAQSTIAGTVRDTSGAILPGVTVEASSDVLIEKTRSVVTDSDGRYAIIDLRPGTYDVTFTLPGFSSLKREAVIVPANVSVPINADLKVGSLEETITVTGASPVVDVQNTSKVQVMTRELMDTIPSARNIQSIGSLVPGVRLNTPDVGGAQQTEQTYMASHGNSAAHNTVLLDSMPAQTNLNDGAVQNYIDNALIAEAVYKTSGVSAETSAGGVFLNLIPKDGGNSIHGQGYFAGSADSWHLQSHNVDDDLLARNLSPTGTRIDHLNDYNFSMGGPIAKDKLWYFASVRHQGTYVLIPNTYQSDGSPGVEDAWIRSFVVRGTYQATAKNKFAFTYQRNYKWKGHEIAFGGQTGLPIFPDVSATKRDPVLYYIAQGKWTSTVTSKLLVEAGLFGRHPALFELHAGRHRPGTQHPGVVRQDLASRHPDQRPARAHQRRTIRSAAHARPALHHGVGVLRDRFTQHQERHAVRVRQQRLPEHAERRPLAELHRRHAQSTGSTPRGGRPRSRCSIRRCTALRS